MKEPLSYKEKQILVSLFNTMIILAAYSYYLHNRYSAFSAEMLSDLQFLGKSFLMLIPITIVIQIVFLIIFHIVLHIISSEKIPEITDERDKLIELKSLRISHWVFITGFFLAMGFNVSYRSYNHRWSADDYRLSVLGFFANGNYHFNTLLDIPQEWDLYAGLSLGFVSVSSPSAYKGGTVSGLGLDLQIGGRYYWNDRWGVNLEFGGGNAASGARIGLSYIL